MKIRNAAVLLKRWAALPGIKAGALAKAVTDSTYWKHSTHTN
jgi:hypothetical protein